MKTTNIETKLPAIQAIKLKEETVPEGYKTPRITRFGSLSKKVRSQIENIVSKSSTVHDVVKNIDEAFPPVLTNRGWSYSKIADIAVASFESKQKLH